MNTRVPWSHQILLEPDQASASRARAFIARHLIEHAAPPGLVDDIRLVGTELATNAILHARTPFTVTLTGHDGFVRVEVQDRSSAGPAARRAKPFNGHGRGMAIVEKVSHRWGIATADGGGKTVWASFDFDHPSGPAGSTRA